MAEKMKSTEFVKRAKQVATDFKTLYVKGCFGAPLTSENKERYIKHNPYNAEAARVKMINAASDDTFGFDCVCLLKGILWGWNGDASHKYGGRGRTRRGLSQTSPAGPRRAALRPSRRAAMLRRGHRRAVG